MAVAELGVPLIELRAITKTYGEGQAAFQALRGIDLAIAEGDFVAVMGPSGSGKSTAMNLLACLDTPSHLETARTSETHPGIGGPSIYPPPRQWGAG